MNIEKRLAEIRDRKTELRSELEKEGITAEDMNKIETELRSLNAEEETLEKRQKIEALFNAGAGTPAVGGNETRTTEEDTEKVYRSAWIKSLMGKPLDEAEQRALAASDVAGAIPTQTQSEIIRKLKQTAPLLNEITLLHFPGNVKFAVEGTKNAATKHTENAEISASDDTLVSVTLGGYEIVKLIRISATVRAMSINSFEAWLVDMIVESLAEKIEDYLVNGSGSSEPQGVEYAATWVANTNARAWAGGSLAAADIHAAIGLIPGGYDRNAKFLMRKKTLWANVMGIRDDSKAPICKEDGKGGYLIYGYPVMLSDKVTDGVIYLGDFKKIVGNLAEDMRVDSSKDSGFAYNAIDYRGTCIFDSKVAVGEAFIKIASSIA